MDIPSSVRWLRDCSFYDCGHLTSVTLHDGLYGIMRNVFQYSSITSLSIPRTVRFIDGYSLGYIEQLESVDVSPYNQYFYSIDGVLFVRNYEINNASFGQALIYYPLNKTNTEYTIPQGTEWVGLGAFNNADRLRKVIFPSTVMGAESAGYYGVFWNCDNLERLDFQNKADNWNGSSNNCFVENCPKLSAVYFYQDAPTLTNYTDIFKGVSPSFCIYYDANTSGWSTPTWHGYPARPFNTPTPPTPTGKKAIIVIPGICGSELGTDAIKYWLPTTWEDLTLQNLHFSDNGVPLNNSIDTWKFGYGVLGTYTYLVTRLQDECAGYDVQYFPYDWRYGNTATAGKLQTFINDNQYDSVVLVAHSMGGLVVSEYIKDAANKAKVEKVITLGTPFLGSAKALNAIENGEFLDPFTWTTIDNRLIKPMAKNLPSIYELLPVEASFEPFINLLMRVDYTYDSLPSATAVAYVPPLTREIESFQRSSLFLNNSRAGTINMARFNDAQRFHAGLNQSGTHEILSLGNKFYCIYGYGQETITKVKYSYASTFTHSMFEAYQLNNGWPSGTVWNADDLEVTDGDGTVTKRSATINNTVEQAYPVKAEHSALPKNADAIDLVVSIINNTAPSASAATVSQRGAKLMIACPVDVQIFNNSTLVGEIVNGVVTQQDPAQVGLHVLGANYDRKLAFLNTTNTYDVVLQGTGVGTMDFSMVLLAADGVTETRSIQFNGVPITASTRITTTSNPSGMVLNIDHNGDGTADETMRPTIDMDLLRQFNIIVAPSTHGSVQLSSPTAKYGDIVTATAVADNGYRLAPGSLQFAGLDALGNVTTAFYTLNIGQFPMLYSDVIIKGDFIPVSTGSGGTGDYIVPRTGDNTPLLLLLSFCVLSGLALAVCLKKGKKKTRGNG